MRECAIETAFYVQELGCISARRAASERFKYVYRRTGLLRGKYGHSFRGTFSWLFKGYLAENLILEKVEGKREKDEVKGECGNAWDMQPLKRQAFLIVSLSFQFPPPK